MDFPTSETEIMAFSQRMLNGYFWHAADFPGILRMKLSSKRMFYINAKRVLVGTRAKLRIATKAKNTNLLELKKVMKECLQRATVDVAASPEKLRLIGWAPKTVVDAASVPNQPTNLRITAKEYRKLGLKWDRPSGSQRIRNYIVERRQQPDNGNSGDWMVVFVSFKTEATLVNQPLGVQVEYRIKAVNPSGESPPSNTVAVVL